MGCQELQEFSLWTTFKKSKRPKFKKKIQNTLLLDPQREYVLKRIFYKYWVLPVFRYQNNLAKCLKSEKLMN